MTPLKKINLIEDILGHFDYSLHTCKGDILLIRDCEYDPIIIDLSKKIAYYIEENLPTQYDMVGLLYTKGFDYKVISNRDDFFDLYYKRS